jgi:AcrR family transcriptional regulator
MARRSPKPRDTKERILAAALSLFGERGYVNTSIDEIAAAAGLTKGALYYYFADKGDIARDLHHEIWTRLKAEAQRGIDPSAGALENLRRAFDAHLAALQNLPEARFFLREFWAVPALGAAGRSEREASLGLIQELLQAGIDRAEIVALDAGILAKVLAGAFSEATLQVLTTGRADATVAVVRRLIEGLAADGSPGGVRTRRRLPPQAERKDSRFRRGPPSRASA